MSAGGEGDAETGQPDKATEDSLPTLEPSTAPAREKGDSSDVDADGTDGHGVDIPDLDRAMALLGGEPEAESQTPSRPMTHAETRGRLAKQERTLIHYDRLLLSSGARLLHALPIVALILLGVGRTFGDRSPGWWDVHLRPSLEVSFSFAVGVVVIFVLVAHLSALLATIRLIWLTRQGLSLETKLREVDGRRFRSVHGHASMSRVVESSYKQHQVTTILVAAAIVLQILALMLGAGSFEAMSMLALGTAALMAGYGIHLLSLGPRFNSVEPCGMLDAYEAPLHPALLDNAFFDVIGTHLDPILSARLSEFLRELSPHLTESLDTPDSLDLVDARERMLHLLLLDHRGVLDEKTRDDALGAILDEEGVAMLVDPEGFGKEWGGIIGHARKRNRSFFRMYDRIRHRLHEVVDGSRPPGGIWFDVDMENRVAGEVNLFTFVHNGTGQPRDLVVRILTPDFRPEEITYNLHLEPGEQHAMTATDSSSVDIAVVNLYHEASLIWQTLLPARTGEATVTARLEDTDGNLVTGRVITVQVRYDLAARVRVWAALLLMAGGGLAVLFRLVEPVLTFLTI